MPARGAFRKDEGTAACSPEGGAAVGGAAMGLWPRLGWTAAVTLALAGGCWWGLRTAGAAGVGALGGVWASRAGGAEGGAGPVVSRSPSGQAVGEVHGPVFGPGSDFRGARISLARGAGAP